MTGRLITFEGIDGAGKSTHLPQSVRLLQQRGIGVVQAREPGGTELAERIRDWFLHLPTDPQTEALLAFAARSDHLARVIRPALAQGRWVICDRFTDSTVAYQGGGRRIGVARVEQLEQWLHPDLQPDRTYLFDVEPDEARRRRAGARGADRFEAEDAAFFERVREGYRERVREDIARETFAREDTGLRVAREDTGLRAAREGTGLRRFLVIDAGQAPEAIWKILEKDLSDCCRRWFLVQ